MKTGIERLDSLVSALKIVILLFFVNGCSAAAGVASQSRTNVEIASGSSGFSHESTDVERLARLWEKRTRESSVSDYPIGPGDVLNISVPAMEELRDRTVRVTAEGTISLVFVGRIQAQGLTEEGLAESLRERLRTYMRNPRVFIFVKEYNSRQMAVLGAVTRPGVYNLTSGTENLLDMIARAGGVLPEAESRILLVPTEPLSGEAAKAVYATLPSGLLHNDPAYPLLKKTKPILIDVKELSSGGHQVYLSLPVRPGDTIMVPGGGQVLVEGWVDKPGSFKFTSGLTVLGAVAAAGGALFPADRSTVRVSRLQRDGNNLSFTADLEKISTGEMPDILLQGGDIVQVSSSAVKLVSYGVYNFLKSVINIGAAIPLIP